MKAKRPGVAIPAGVRKTLIAFARLRRHSEIEVLRVYRRAPMAVQGSMVREMRAQLEAEKVRVAEEREHWNACALDPNHTGTCSVYAPPAAQLGAPGRDRLARVMGKEPA